MTSPIPPDQQPLNEFNALQESWFFAWGNKTGWTFWRTVLLVWLGWAILAVPLSLASFDPHRHPLKFLSATCAGACIGLGFILLRLFLGWGYIYDRLVSPTILYEETGWYDGQAWEKPELELTQHRLIANYQIQPILERLRRLGLGILILLVISLSITVF